MKIFTRSFVLCILTLLTMNLYSQSRNEEMKNKYRRSSLHTILIESDNFPQKETVIKAYNNAPFPDKYNNHEIGEHSFDPKEFVVSDEERIEAGLKEDTKLGKLIKASGLTYADSVSSKDMPIIIQKYFDEDKIANQLIAKWFNRQEDGSFNMDLVSERGHYNASEMEASIAKQSKRGVAALADAGEQLIKNTFVVVSKMSYVSNEVAALAILEASKLAASKIQNSIAQIAANKAAEIVYQKTREGYSVWTVSYLYQLNWNDSTAAVFYNDLWMNKNNVDIVKKDNFDKTDLFKLNYIGKESSSSLVTFTLKGRTEEEIVEQATVRNIEDVYVKLQKKYDVFKTKTPIISVDPITARIGMKEGLTGGEVFEVFEQSMNLETGMTEFVKVGKIKVDPKNVWDNRYCVGIEEDRSDSDISMTSFKGGKNLGAGMLIRQLN